MVFYRHHTQLPIIGDFLIAESGTKTIEHVLLAAGQIKLLVTPMPRAHRRRHIGFSRNDQAQNGDQRVRLHIIWQKGNSTGRHDHVGRQRVHAGSRDRDWCLVTTGLAEIPQPLQSVHIRHLHVEHNRIKRLQGIGCLNGGRKAARCSHTDVRICSCEVMPGKIAAEAVCISKMNVHSRQSSCQNTDVSQSLCDSAPC